MGLAALAPVAISAHDTTRPADHAVDTISTPVVNVANAAPATVFTSIIEGALRKASGTPAPPSGNQATLWGNKSSATTTAEGSGRVLVGAIGTFCADWPRIRVTVDGKVAGTSKIVDAQRYGAYPVGTAVGSGRHVVKIQYINDFRNSTCDRNVHLGFVQMENRSGTSTESTTGPTASPTSTPTATSTATPTSPPIPDPATPSEVADEPVTPGPAVTPTPVASGSSPTSTGATAGPGNSGVPSGTVLKRHDGDLTVTTAGTVIDGLDIHGFLRIRANDVTVRRTMIRGGATGNSVKALISADGTHRNLRIEDSTLKADTASPYMNGIIGRNFTAVRVDISNVVDNAMVVGDNVTIKDSWFHGTTRFTPWPFQPDNQTHNDNVQIEGGNNILIQGNRFEGASNTAIMITQNVSRSQGIRVVNNLLTEGDCTVNISEKGKGPIQSTFAGNRFAKSGIAKCAIVAKTTSFPSVDGNVWDGTSTPIVIRTRPT